jgi:pimeloyl-ACP methyl ester carboxylesterase
MWLTQPHYTLADLATIKAPTLLIAGQFDAVKREHTDQLAKAISGSDAFIIEGGTHSELSERADIVNARILRFLE